MRFIDRMALLAKADAHGVMDQLEERTLLLKQHLRDAEHELDRKRARLETLADTNKAVSNEVERLATRVAGLDEDIELALAAGNEDLARFAARKLLPARDALAELRRRFDENEAETTELGATLAEQEQAFDDLKTRVRSDIAAARQRHESPRSSTDELGGTVPDEEVEFELMRRRTAASGGTQ